MKERLPDGWRACQLGDVVPYGKTEKIEPQAISPDEWLLELEDIEKDTSRILDVVRAEDRQPKSTKNRFRAGDVLYGKLRPYLNKVVVAPRDGCCTTEIIPIRPTEALSGRFLFYWMKSKTFLDYTAQVSHGVNMPRLGTKAGRAAPLVLPPPEDQDRIVEKVDALFAHSRKAKESLDRVPALLEKLKKSILAAAFRGDLTKDWREANPDVEPADQLLARIRTERRRRWEEAELAKLRAKGKEPKKDTWRSRYRAPNSVKANLPGLPGSWTSTTVVEVAVIASGQTPKGIDGVISSTGEVPWFRVADMNTPGNATEMRRPSSCLTRSDTASLGLHVRPPGTIIFPKRGGAISTNKKRLLVSPAAYDLNTMGLVCAESVQPFVWWWFQSVDLRSLGDGSSVPQINNGDIEPLPVPLPPQEEQVEIVRRLHTAFSLIEATADHMKRTTSQREQLTQAILAKAFRGELVEQVHDA